MVSCSCRTGTGCSISPTGGVRQDAGAKHGSHCMTACKEGPDLNRNARPFCSQGPSWHAERFGGLSCYRTDFEVCTRLWHAWLERHPELCTMYIPRSVVKRPMQDISTYDVTIPTNLYGIGLDACRCGWCIQWCMMHM